MLKAIDERRSIRKYTSATIDNSIIDEMIYIGRFKNDQKDL